MSVPGYKHIPGVPFAVPADMPEEEVAAMRNYFSQQAEAEAGRFNTGTQLTRENYANQSSIAAANNAARIREAAMQIAENKRQFDQTFGLDTRKFGLDTEKFGETKREFDLGYGLDKDKFGADVLFKGASLRGPRDWIQGDMYAQGAGQSGLSPYLQSLTGGTAVGYGGGTAQQGNPTPLTVGTMANELTGQQGTSTTGGLGAAPGAPGQPAAAGAATDQFGRPRLSPTAQSAVDATAKVYERGIANTPQGFFENMTPGQLDAFKSQSDYLGRDVSSELEYWKRSRARQGSALGA